jgi:16S rRNA (uracil1498-N3)-methyltransferase
VYRFYAPALRDDASFDLPEAEAQPLSRVLRLRPGESIAVFDGRGREYLARVEAVSARRVSVRAVSPREAAPEPAVAITLAQALLKSDKMDRVIRDAVMLGVAAVQPFVSRRTEVPMKAVVGGGRHERWDRTVVSSVKQCGRAVVPPVRPAAELHDVLTLAGGEPRLMFVEPAAGVPCTALTALEGRRPAAATVLIGPEGGWDAEEVRDAAAAGVTLLSFGARVLRADAAAAAVIAVLRYIWRDL